MRWRAYFLFGVVAMGAFALMWDPTGGWSSREVRFDPPRALAQRLAAEADQVSRELRVALVLDSLAAHLAREVPDGGFILGSPESVPLRDVDWIRATGARIHRARDATLDGLMLGFFAVDSRIYGQGRRDDGLPRDLVVAGRADGAPFCLRLHAVDASRARVGPERLVNASAGREGEVRLMRLCAWVARFGMPGADLAGWLKLHGQESGERWMKIHDAFALPPGTRFDDTQDLCRAGDDARCLADFRMRTDRSLGEPEVARRGPDAVLLFVNDLPYGEGPANQDLLGDLEREFGEAAFRRFWQSDLPLEDSFREAFGVGLAGWYRNRLIAFWGPLRAGPSARLQHVLVTLGMLLAGLVAGSLVTRRRTVE